MSERQSGGAYGCQHCWPADAATAYASSRSLNSVAQLIDESHYLVSIRDCRHCGQHFLSVFTEWIDWTHGEDPQYRTLLPLSAQEAQDLIAVAPEAITGTINSLGRERACLQHDFPSDTPVRTMWATGFFVGPHD